MLAVGVGLHHYAHHDVRSIALQVVHQFHLDPASHYPGVFLRLAENVTDTRLQMLALGALAYATVRFIEAYGLWFRRRWGEWFAAVAAAIYIPFELYHIWLHPTGVKVALLVFNVVIVVYLARVLWRSGTKNA